MPDYSDSTQTDDTAEVDFIELARERYTVALEADREDRAEAKLDIEFVAGNQWDSASIDLRKALFRPMLTWNRLHTFSQQVCNDGRQNKPGIVVTPGDGGDKRTAQLKQDRIRQIEYESDADVAKDTARDGQVNCGRGFYRITTEWAKGKWKQVIRLKSIDNPFAVLYDPLANEYDRSDAEYLFVDSYIGKKAYKRRYPKAPLAQNDFFADGENPAPDWINTGETGNSVRLAEYWVKTYRPYMLAQLLNGESVRSEDLRPGQVAIKEREDYDCTVTQYIIDGVSILAETEFPIDLFPIVPMWGRQEVVNGKKRNVSLGRFAHDAQKLVNLYVSNIAEQIAMMPKAPYVAYEGTIDEGDKAWEEVNNLPKAYLLVKPVVVSGNLLPLPQRVAQEPPIQALSIGLGQAVDALKAACGIYDASLGNAPNDASGLAIERRNNESDIGNFHFGDNEARSNKYAGRVVLKLMAALEANHNSITVRSEDGKTSNVKLRTPVRHQDGSTVTHNLDEGDDEVHVSQGASYTSQRQQQARILGQLAQSDKNFMMMGGDMLFRAMDFPGADELADRYKKMLPPQLQQAGDPTVLQGQLQQASGMLQQLTAKVHELQTVIDNKQIETQGRIVTTAMQEKTKLRNIEVQATIAQANLGLQAATTQLAEETDAIEHSMNHVSDQAQQEFEALMQHYANLGDTQDAAAAEAQQGAAQ